MTDGSPLVSVVMAARDAAPYIARTLASVEAQTYERFEVVVVVDETSTDGTAAVAEAAVGGDPRFRIVEAPRLPLPAARNHAISLSTGDVVVALDADDLWHPRRLEDDVASLAAVGDDVAGVWTTSVAIDEDDVIIGAGQSTTFDRTTMASLGPWVLLPLVYRCFMVHPMVRRPCVEAVRGYDERVAIGDDYDYALRLAERFPLARSSALPIGYRQRSGSLSSDGRSTLADDMSVLHGARQRSPWIPHDVLRWARSGRYLYAASRSFRWGDRRDALRWAATATVLDPLAVLHPRNLSALRSLRRAEATAARPLRYPDDLEAYLARLDRDVSALERVYERLERRRHRRLAQAVSGASVPPRPGPSPTGRGAAAPGG